MLNLSRAFWNDDSGFIVSVELILVATIGVLSLIVGLTEVTFGINEELEDVGSAIGSINQSFCFNGVCGHKGHMAGSRFHDDNDACDGEHDLFCNTPGVGECASVCGNGHGHGNGHKH